MWNRRTDGQKDGRTNPNYSMIIDIWPRHSIVLLPMESRFGHAHKMMFLLKCIGKKQHQKVLFSQCILMFFFAYNINTYSVNWFNLEYLCNRWSDVETKGENCVRIECIRLWYLSLCLLDTLQVEKY